MGSANVGYRKISDFLIAAINLQVQPILYFDTCVYMDIVDQTASEIDSARLFEFACGLKWLCYTSIFAKIETLEVKQKEKFRCIRKVAGWSESRIKHDYYNRDLAPKDLGNVSRSLTVRDVRRCRGFKLSNILKDGWQLAEEIKRKTNLTDKDSIHLAEARAIACDIFITRDKHLLSIARKYIWAETPGSMIRILCNLGFSI
jgi:hypothetical protein